MLFYTALFYVWFDDSFCCETFDILYSTQATVALHSGCISLNLIIIKSLHSIHMCMIIYSIKTNFTKKNKNKCTIAKPFSYNSIISNRNS